jgi:hypothetical protein
MLGLSTLLVMGSLAAFPITDADWQIMNQGGVIGTRGGVSASVFRQGKLYVGGRMNIAGTTFVKNLAVWDGRQWAPFGKGADRDVQGMTQDRDGNIYVSGDFDTVDGVTAKHVAKWDGRAWSQLGGGLAYYPRQMVGNETGTQYVLGGYAAAVGRWNGTVWDSIPYDTSLVIRDMAIDSRDHLYLCGSRRNTSLDVVVREWDGQAWKTLADTSGGAAYTIAVNSKGVVTLGGWFGYGISPSVRQRDFLIKIRDGKWMPDQRGSFSSDMNEIDQLYYDQNDNLFLTGEKGTYRSRFSARIDTAGIWKSTSTWGAFGLKVAISADGKGGAYFGDRYWNGSEAVELKSDLYVDNRVTALAADHRGNVYIGGWFSRFGGVAAPAIARWNAGVYSALGIGLDKGRSGQYTVGAMTIDSKGRLVVVGDFAQAGEVAAHRIARWDGQAWSALGTGVSDFYPSVDAVIDDGQGNIVVGGQFDNVGGESVNNIARWDGAKWSGIGGGFRPYPDKNWAFAYAIAVDANAHLVVGGSFGTAGKIPADNIAKWDGIDWKPYHQRDSSLPDWSYGFRWTVRNVLVDQSNTVFASVLNPYGLFKRTTAGWVSLGVDTIQAMVADDEGNIYVAGGLQKKGFIQRYDGKEWSTLGSGVDGPVYCLAISDSTLYVGGEFTLAGGKLSPGLAKVNIHSFSKPGAVFDRAGTVFRPRAYFTGDVLHLRTDGRPLQRVELLSLSGRILFSEDLGARGAKTRFKVPPLGEKVLVCRWIGTNRRTDQTLLFK